jgi:serine protease Do
VNPHIDLALLKIDADELADFPLKRVHFGNVDELEKGETVFAVGAPLGLERSVSEGIVSIKNRAQNGIVYVQTTAAVNPGNSGGPLFNQKGEVIGVNTWGYMFSEGLNFSIPINFVKFFIDNRDAFAFDKDNPNTGYRYLQPPGRVEETPTGN